MSGLILILVNLGGITTRFFESIRAQAATSELHIPNPVLKGPEWKVSTSIIS